MLSNNADSIDFLFDVFISYSRKDIEFVRQLEKALRNYIPPKDLQVPHKHLKVFRDESDLVGSDLTLALEDNLRRSAKLVVVCSQASRLSKYVGLEIRKFAELRGSSNIIAVTYCDPQSTEELQIIGPEMLFHEELTSLFDTPLAEDYRGFDSKKNNIDSGQFQGRWIGILARIYDKMKAEVEQRELRRQAYIRRLWTVALVSIVIALSSLTLWAVIEGQNAVRQSKVALSRQLSAQAIEVSSRSFDLSLLLGQQAVATHESIESKSTLAQLIHLRGHLYQYLSGHKDTLWSVSFSPDGTKLATASQDKSVILWDVKTGRQTGEKYYDFLGAVRSVVFSPDGKTIAAADETGLVTLRELGTGGAYRLSGHKGKVLSVAYSPDGSMLATAGADGKVFVWDTVKHTVRFSLFDANRSSDVGIELRSVAYSRDGKLLASGSVDGNVSLWDTQAGTLLKRFQAYQGAVQTIAFSPNGMTFASGGEDGAIKIWTINTTEQLHSFPAHSGKIYALAFIRNGELIASAGEDRIIAVRDSRNGQEAFQLNGHEGAIYGLAVSQDGNTLASASFDKKAIQWNVAADSRHVVFGSQKAQIRDIAFRPDGKQMATVSWEGDLVIWDTSSGRSEEPIRGHSNKEMYRVAYSPDGTWMATAGGDGTVVIWDAKMHSKRLTLTGHGKPVRSLAISQNGKYVASGDRDGKIIMWDVATGKAISRPNGHDVDTAVYGLAFSSDGKILVSVGFDKKVIIRDPLSGAPQKDHSLHPDAVRAVAISPDGKTVASGSVDGMIVLWDYNANVVRKLYHVAGVEALAFSPDGKVLVSVGDDRTAIIWDAETGAKLAHLKGHTAKVYAVAFNPGNAFKIATAGMDGGIRFWDIRPENWNRDACEIANRNLTCAEWNEFLGADITYQLSCVGKPLPPDWIESRNGCEPAARVLQE